MSQIRKSLTLIRVAAVAMVLPFALIIASNASAKAVYWVNYGSGPKIEPKRVLVYKDFVTHAKHWRHWGGHNTRAKGRIHYNDCRPSCAEGHYRKTPGRVTLSHIHRCGNRLQYRKVHLTFTNKPKR